MKMNSVWLGSLFATLLLTGCATYRPDLVFPRAEGRFEVQAFASKESRAMKDALDKSRLVCDQERKDLVVLDKQIAYHGALSEEGNKFADQLSHVISEATKHPVPSASTNEDYQVILMIECRSRPS